MPRKNQPLVKPYLKWAGGKRQLLPEIRKYIPAQIGTYYEPFVGAGAVFFDVQPNNAVISDINAQLILTYRVIRDNLDELIAALKVHSDKNDDKYYYEIRLQDREQAVFDGLSTVEKAARFIFLNKTCYNGLYRVNSQGLFNVPYGRYKNPTICEEPVLRAISKYLKKDKVQILNSDFAEAVQNSDEHSFVYFDPPYHSPDNTNFTGYQANEFGEQEQTRLRDTFLELTERGVKCLLSNSDTPFIRALYTNDKFDINTVTAKRAINSDSAGRGNVNEVLVKNWR